MTRLIALKELRSLLCAPSTWLMLGVLQFIVARSFLARLDVFLQLQSTPANSGHLLGATQVVVPDLFSIIAVLLATVTPLFTMRLLAEEQRNQTLPLLLAAPVSDAQIVLGKFFGLVSFLWLIILGWAAMSLVLMVGTPMDIGLLTANTIGLLLLSASYAALGLYLSALTAQPIIAALAAFAVLFGLWLIEASTAGDNPLWQALTPAGHFQVFSGGLVDSSGVIYYVLFCAVCLVLAMRRIRTNRFGG